ncbi:MAG TPA: hypothetical protein VJA21_20125 [Verrucomicrobiae bacterium]
MKQTLRSKLPNYLVILASLVIAASTARSQNFPRVWNPPASATFWSMQLTNQPPLPFLPDFLSGRAVYQIGPKSFLYDDLSIDYAAVAQLRSDLDAASGVAESTSLGGMGLSFGPGDLWLEIQRGSNPDQAELTLHGTTVKLYQWVASPTLALPFGVPPWVPGEVYDNAAGADPITFIYPVATTLPMRFFRAVGGDTVVSIKRDIYVPDAIEPCSPPPNDTPQQVGGFDLTISPTVNRTFTIVYALSGTAQNGTDYTNLSGSVEVLPNTSTARIYVHPYYDTNLEFEESVTLTLVLTNGYLIQPGHSSATVFINDCIPTNLFTVVATNIPSPIEIDYHPPTSSLLLSMNYDSAGADGNFVRLDSDGRSNRWSTISGLYDEVKFAIPKATTNGWTNGCMFFGRDTHIGYLSSNASGFNFTWTTLTNGIVTNALYLRGSLCFDETGIWSNNLIAVTSDEGPEPSIPKGVWQVDSHGHVGLITNLNTPHLEGVITMPNDAARWGPWAGKILTGDESLVDENYEPVPLIYAIDTNGVATAYSLGSRPEDFDIVPANQDLYCVNYNTLDSKVLKISKTVLTNYVGDLLITQAGELNPYNETELRPRLFFVHWNGLAFSTRSIALPEATFPGYFEHVTFAPVTLPDIPQ